MSQTKRHRGIALIWTALVLLILVGFLGLAVDYGKAVVNTHELHNGADAGSLAGALYVKKNTTQARNEAVRIAGLNESEHLSISVDHNWGNDPLGEVVIGRWISQERLFVPTMFSPNAVKVLGKRLGERENAPRLSLLFGPIWGTAEAGVSRHAIAKAQGSVGAGIITLSANPKEEFPGIWKSHETGFVAGGGSVIDLRGYHWQTGEAMLGDIQINAESMEQPKAGFVFNGNSADIWAGDFNIVGTSWPDPDSDWSGLYGDDNPENWFSINTEQPRIEDPLIELVPPVMGEPVISETIDDQFIVDAYNSSDPRASFADGVYSYEIPPGYYPGGINISGHSVTDPITGVTTSFRTQVILDGGIGVTGEPSERSGIFGFGGGAGGDSGMVIRGTSSVVEKYPPVDGSGNPIPPAPDVNRGVMIYITGDPANGVAYGEVDITGGGYIQVSPRGDWLATRVVEGELGVSIWQDRNNPNLAQIRGSADFFLSGTIYMGYNPVKVTGSTDNLGSQLILGALEVDGGLAVRVGYDGRNQNSSMRAFLVD